LNGKEERKKERKKERKRKLKKTYRKVKESKRKIVPIHTMKKNSGNNRIAQIMELNG